MRYTSLLLLFLLMGTGACGDAEPGFHATEHESEVMAWREGRLARLRSPTGFLALAGLFWLEDGQYTFGSATDCDFVFPQAAPERIGTFELMEEGVFMRVAEGTPLKVNEQPARSMLLKQDTTGEPDIVSLGSLSWYVVERAGRFGVRLRDSDNPAITDFPPLQYFPVDPRWRVEGRLEPFDSPKVMDVDTVIEGLGYHPTSPGRVEFEVDGALHALDAYESGERLFFIFADGTTGRETYPAGRFLYADLPDENGITVLDFNKAYSPPCAFNDFATCPVASPRNRLPVRVEAGELFDPVSHRVPGASH